MHITCCSWLLEVDIDQAGGLEKFTSLGKQVWRLKPMLRVSLPKEPVAMALAMAWGSSLALVRQALVLRGRVLLGKLTWISPLLLA